MRSTTVIIVSLFCAVVGHAQGEFPPVDTLPVLDELPNPFVMNDGTAVTTAEQWRARRGEILDMILYYEYGRMPPAPADMKVEDVTNETLFDGAAVLRRATLTMGPDHAARMRVALYVPQGKPGPFPVIVAIEPVWQAHLYPVAQRIVETGYIFAGFERHDLDPDDADRSDGVHPLYPDYDWASLAVWAWGCMRVVDYLETVDAVDAEHIALWGHSRAGKVTLLAGALDERIALVAPHASGSGGAASHRIDGKGCETLDLITQPERFHYWFHPRLRTFTDKEDRLPFDQHFLRAAVAPRAVLSVEGLEDLWCNPLGTQHMYVAAQPVFDFLGVPGHNAVSFRDGGHDTTMDDWNVVIEYADHVFFDKPLTRTLNKLPFPDAEKAFSWTAPKRE